MRKKWKLPSKPFLFSRDVNLVIKEIIGNYMILHCVVDGHVRRTQIWKKVT